VDDARGVTPEAIVEVAETVVEKIDVLLERATDAVLGAPRPGTPLWRQAWESRESESGRAALEQRARVKIAIAELAGVDPRHEYERARRAGVLPIRTEIAEVAVGQQQRVSRRRGTAAAASRSESQQLAIW
jgi:hypothetical protein